MSLTPLFINVKLTPGPKDFGAMHHGARARTPSRGDIRWEDVNCVAPRAQGRGSVGWKSASRWQVADGGRAAEVVSPGGRFWIILPLLLKEGSARRAGDGWDGGERARSAPVKT